MGGCVSCKVKSVRQRPGSGPGPGPGNITVSKCYGLPEQIDTDSEFNKKPPKIMIIDNRFILKRFKCFHSSSKSLNMKTNDGDCLICWKKIREDQISLKSCCAQHYHEKCFFKWMKVRNICPICRQFVILVKNKVYKGQLHSMKIRKTTYDTYNYRLFNLDGEEVNIKCLFEPEFEDIGFFNNENDENDENDEVESYSEESSEELLELVSVSEESSYDEDIINQDIYSIEDDSLEHLSLPILEEELLQINNIDLNNINNINLPNSIEDIEFKTELEVS